MLYNCPIFYLTGDISLLVDHFLDIFHETILHKMQATLILNEVVLGAAGIGGMFYTILSVRSLTTCILDCELMPNIVFFSPGA